MAADPTVQTKWTRDAAVVWSRTLVTSKICCPWTLLLLRGNCNRRPKLKDPLCGRWNSHRSPGSLPSTRQCAMCNVSTGQKHSGRGCFTPDRPASGRQFSTFSVHCSGIASRPCTAPRRAPLIAALREPTRSPQMGSLCQERDTVPLSKNGRRTEQFSVWLRAELLPNQGGLL